MKFKLTNKNEIEFEKIDPKQSNIIKIRLHSNDTDVEGIWACVSDEDFKAYNNDTIDKEPCRVANLRNSALMFYPNNSWGWYIPIQLKGRNRPECNVAWIDKTQTPLKNLDETIPL